MKILIIGGTIFLGRHLTEIALQAGHQVTLFNRGNHRNNIPKGVEFIKGERKILSDLATKNWDVIIDTCGYLPEDVQQTAGFFSERAKKYVFISSVSVYDDFSKSNIDETATVSKLADPQDRELNNKNYGALKALCEKEVEKYFSNRFLIVRPGLIIGRYDQTDRFTYWPVRIHNGGEILVPEHPCHFIQYIDVCDLAKFIIHLLENDVNGTFNVTGPDYKLSFKEFLNNCQSYAQNKVDFNWIPREFLENELNNMNKHLPFMELPSNYKGIDEIDSSKALENGLICRDLDETIEDLLDWFDTLPSDYQMKVGLKPEDEQAILNNYRNKVREE